MNPQYKSLVKFIAIHLATNAISYLVIKECLIKPLGEAADKARKEREAQKIDLDVPEFMVGKRK